LVRQSCSLAVLATTKNSFMGRHASRVLVQPRRLKGKGRLLPQIPLQTGHWGDITRVERPMGQVDPLLSVVTGSHREFKLAGVFCERFAQVLQLFPVWRVL